MFGVRLSKMGSASKLGLIAKAIGILRKYGADAHVYLPGIGTVSGLTAGNYLDSAGTTAATVDNPVGLSLDALQAMTIGGEVCGDVNLSTPAYWTAGAGWTVAGNKATHVAGSTANLNPATNNILTIGKAYAVTLAIDSISGGAVSLPNLTNSVPITTPGTVTQIGVATFSGFFLQAAAATNVVTSSISIKQIPGIHATQATTANKPILRRGLLNQALNSKNITGAAWIPANLAAIASNLLTPINSAVVHRVDQVITTVAGAVTLCFEVRPNGYTKFGFRENTTSGAWATFDCSGAGALLGSASVTATSISLISAGSYRVVVTFTASSAANTFATYVLDAAYTNVAPHSYTYTPDAVSGMYLDAFGLFQGTYTAQQIIDAGGIPLTTSAAASSATGKYWWQFDSTDSLTATYPAGYESATIINALTSGVTTTQGVNVVGSYSIGPSVNTAGRIVLKTAPTAEKLAVLQSFMGLSI